MQIEITPGLAEISATDWDALAGEDDPFLEHAFLLALETSGSVGPKTGWTPHHLLCREHKTGPLLGAIPLYLKDHSYGEYIFDWGWAGAAKRAGIRYYPKLLSAIPFTPATGQRILAGDPQKPAAKALIQAARAETERLGASSLHFLFTTAEERTALAKEHGLLPRLTYQFHWESRGYQSFEDFLKSLRSEARKQIRKERATARESGLRLHTKRGPEMSEAEWRSLYRFYRQTAAEKGAIPYLTPRFFEEIRQKLPQRVVVAFASRGEEPLAGALAFQKGKNLYGRYWGSLVEASALHFELCYYQLIEFACVNGLQRFEAGAQGEHKLKRGFLPSPTYSAHWIRHAGFSEAIADYLAREAEATEAEISMLSEHGPFPRGPR
jgi:uncharacterized protein